MSLLRLALAAPLLWALGGTPAHADAPAPSVKSAIPYKQEKDGAGAQAYQSVAALVLVGLAAYGAVLFLKKSGMKGVGPLRSVRRVRLLESTRLSRRSTLHVVEYHGEELLLAESEHGLRLVNSRAATPAMGEPDA
jgi:hypothetical protein